VLFRPNPLTPFPAREGGKFSRGLRPGERLTTKMLANPQPTGVGKLGGPGGRSPHGGGLWGVSPHKIKRGGELPTLATCPRVGPKTPANPQPTRVGKLGVEGAEPPPRGFGGCAPKNLKKGGEQPTLATCPRVGPNTLANPQPTRVGKLGVEGRSPSQGVWGMSPKNLKKGESSPP